MTIQELSRLIASHNWLSEELAAQIKAGDQRNRDYLKDEMERLFLKIVEFPSDNPYICCAQIDFLVTAIGDLGGHDETRSQLCDMTLVHLRRLAKVIRNAKSAQSAQERRRPDLQRTTAVRFPLRTGSA